MTKYKFTLILKGQLALTEEIADERFEAGCNDGTWDVQRRLFH